MQVKWIIILIVLIISGCVLLSFVFDPFAHVARYDARASVAIGDAFMSSGQPEWSTYWYDRALADLPNDTEILKIRGNAYLKNGQVNEAKQVFEEVLSLNNNDTVALQRKGVILTREGNYSGAIACYDKVLAQNPNDAPVLVLKGDTLLLTSISQQQAFKDYTRNISKSFNSDTSANAQSYDAFQATVSYQEAVRCYNQAMKINPALTVPITAKIMGVTMNQINEYEEILNDLNS